MAAAKPYQPGTKVLKPAPEWFYPGDRARIEPNGMLVIVGRVNEVINIGGLKVSPESVEALVTDRADVADAAAVGIAGRSGLEEVWLAVVPRGSVDAAEILAHCKRKAPVLAPTQVEDRGEDRAQRFRQGRTRETARPAREHDPCKWTVFGQDQAL